MHTYAAYACSYSLSLSNTQLRMSWEASRKLAHTRTHTYIYRSLSYFLSHSNTQVRQSWEASRKLAHVYTHTRCSLSFSPSHSNTQVRMSWEASRKLAHVYTHTRCSLSFSPSHSNTQVRMSWEASRKLAHTCKNTHRSLSNFLSHPNTQVWKSSEAYANLHKYTHVHITPSRLFSLTQTYRCRWADKQATNSHTHTHVCITPSRLVSLTQTHRCEWAERHTANSHTYTKNPFLSYSLSHSNTQVRTSWEASRKLERRCALVDFDVVVRFQVLPLDPSSPSQRRSCSPLQDAKKNLNRKPDIHFCFQVSLPHVVHYKTPKFVYMMNHGKFVNVMSPVHIYLALESEFVYITGHCTWSSWIWLQVKFVIWCKWSS